MTDVQLSDEETGKKAYETYCWFTGHKTHDGRPMPPWAGLPKDIRDAWRAAAQGALNHARRVNSLGRR